MNYEITTLVENGTYGRGLQGEHGLSLLIEAGEHRVLSDTDTSDLFTRNARLVGVGLAGVEFVILSHRHCDHTGGLYTFLKMSSRTKAVCKQEVFRRKFKSECENEMLHPEALGKLRSQLIDETTEIVLGVSAFPDARIVDKNDTHFEYFFVGIGGEMHPDIFEDELALILRNGKSLSVLSTCSHQGITSIIRAAQAAFLGLGLGLAMGGFYIRNAGIEKFNVISVFLGMKLPKRPGVCRCMGIDKYALFRQQFSDRVFCSYTGWIETV